MPTANEIRSIIERHLKTIPKQEKIEIAFFGGTFTFLPEGLQERYLDTVFHYVKKRKVHSLRISTHPEAVDAGSMKRFKKRGGRLVELGIQSLDKTVLKNIKRETNFDVIEKAGACIKKAGLKLGVQVMLGLPGDSLKKSRNTARRLVTLGPETARIYPVIVLKGTELAECFKKRRYKPLSLEEAIDQAAEISDIFERSGIKVIRIGLHPSEDLSSKKVILGGPYHRAFGEMARSRQIRNKIIERLDNRQLQNRSYLEIQAPENMFNLISGHRSSERRFLEKRFGVPVIYKKSKDKAVRVTDVRKDIAVVDPRMPAAAKKKLKKLNYYVAEVNLNRKLQRPVAGHVDMMLFRCGDKIIYEPGLENIADLLRSNGHNCVKGERILSTVYPKNIIYNACCINGTVIRYKGRVEKNIKVLGVKHILVNQGYAKCLIVPVDKRRIITSDRGIKEAWEKNGGKALLIRPGNIKLPGYKTGFIGGASGINDKSVLFAGRLNTHPDGQVIRDFIKRSGKGVIELYDGPLYDVGTIYIFKPGLGPEAHQEDFGKFPVRGSLFEV